MLNLPADFPLNIFDNQRGICISRRPVRTNDGNELHLLIAKRPSTRAFLCLSASWIRRLTYVRISTSFGIYPVWAARGHLWFYLILSLVVLTIVRPRSVRLVPCVSTTEPNRIIISSSHRTSKQSPSSTCHRLAVTIVTKHHTEVFATVYLQVDLGLVTFRAYFGGAFTVK